MRNAGFCSRMLPKFNWLYKTLVLGTCNSQASTKSNIEPIETVLDVSMSVAIDTVGQGVGTAGHFVNTAA